jgi:hypothetical protein
MIWALATMEQFGLCRRFPIPTAAERRYSGEPGDGKWNEINTPNPGAATITGTGPGGCFYTTSGGDLWELAIDGRARPRSNWASGVVEIDYGTTGILWAVFPDKAGEAATLHYGYLGPSPFTFKLFPGNVSPTSISANSNCNCYGLVSGKPVQYSQNGSSQIFDKGAKFGLNLSFKQGSVAGQDLFYLTTANGNLALCLEAGLAYVDVSKGDRSVVALNH